MASPAGMRFGRYEVLFRVAKGGMAEVFAGRIRAEAGFERLVAVKRMLPHLADDERFVAMFLDEARLAAAVSSAHVVPTLDLGRDPQGSPYIVMQLVVGASLSQLLQRAVTDGPPVPLAVGLEIVAQTCLGLHHAHEARTASGEPLALVHRDVSPQNILVSASGTVLVTDFGIAKGAIARLAHSHSGGLKGKLAYLSPEQATGDDVDRRTDIYSLGIVAWETIANRRLHVADSDAELLTRVRNPPTTPPLASVVRGVPEVVSDAVARAMARDPRDRWQTAEAFADALRAGLRVAAPDWGGAGPLGRWLTDDPPQPMIELRRRLQASSHASEATEPAVDAPEPSFVDLEAMTLIELSDADLEPGFHQESTRNLIDAAEGTTTPLLGATPTTVPPLARPRLRWGALLAMALVLSGVTALVTWAVRRGVADDPPAPAATLPPLPPREEPPPEPVVVAPEVVPEEPAAIEPAPSVERPARGRRRRRPAQPTEEPAPRRGGALGMSAFDQSTGR